MATVQQAFDLALQYHQAGRLAEAEALYRKILAVHPNHTDLPRLSHLRGTLRQRMEQSPLMDAPRFARNIEAAYRAVWRQWCAQPAETS